MDISQIKTDLWKQIDAREDELIKLCSDLISINSENPPGHMEEITNFITSYLEKNNIEFKIVKPSPETPNIIAEIGKKEGRTLLLNGHSDVVPVGDLDKWDFDPFSGKVVDGKILGRGASDMKAGLGGLLFAMTLIKENNIDLKGSAVLTVVPDEEVSGKMGTKWLLDNDVVTGDACIVAEPSGYNNIEIGQKGSVWVTLKAKGKSAHGSLAPYAGDNAIEKIIKICDELKTLRQVEADYPPEIADVIAESKAIAREELKIAGVENIIDHITVNLGKISGGIKANMVPDYAEAQVDLRLPVGIKASIVEDKIKEAIEKHSLSGITYECDWKAEANYTDARSEIVEIVAQNAEKILGTKVTRTYQWASSDARYYRLKGIPTLQFGPANTEGIHAYNETVDVKDVINAAKVYVGSIIDYLNL